MDPAMMGAPPMDPVIRLQILLPVELLKRCLLTPLFK
jgi:hypothetical protein